MTNGLRMIVDPRRERVIGASIYFRGSYEPNLMWLLSKLLRSGDVFVDIGASLRCDLMKGTASASHFFKNVRGLCGPNERLGSFVVILDVLVNG